MNNSHSPSSVSSSDDSASIATTQQVNYTHMYTYICFLLVWIKNNVCVCIFGVYMYFYEMGFCYLDSCCV